MVSNDLVPKFAYRVHWSEEDQAFIGTCIEFPLLSSFGETMEDALKGIRSVVAEGVQILVEHGEEVPEPIALRKYSGQLTLRIPPETHRRLVLEAQEQGISLNQYITTKLESASAYFTPQKRQAIKNGG